MVRFSTLSAVLALASAAYAQCGAGSPHATVTGSSGSYTARRGGSTLYSGSDYLRAIQTAVDAISSGQRVAVMASGNIGANTITIGSGKTFEGCGTITAGNRPSRGAIDARSTQNGNIPYLSLAGTPSFGMHFSGTRGLTLGEIEMSFSSGSGIGIRFDRDAPMNYDVTMGNIRVVGAGSHAVETWNIDGLSIGSIVARNVGECGLLLQRTTNARVGLVDGDNVARGTGYATFRMANENGRLNGGYGTNVYVDRVVSRGGGRGIFCVSESGGAEIANIDLANNGNNAILIENCFNVRILGGTVNGGGEVRLAARTEFANNRDISITARVDGTTVHESPCGTNSYFSISGNARMNVCSGSTRPPTSTSGPGPTTSSGGGGGNCSPRWAQCGGEGWNGPRCCESGATCQAQNQWYSQCL